MNTRKIPASDPQLLRWCSLLLFKLAWWLLVLGQTRWQWWVLGLLLPLQLLTLVVANRQQGIRIVLCRCLLLASAGLLFDQCLGWLQILQFPAPLLPLWLVALWLAFALVLPHLRVWLAPLNWWSLAVVGSVAGVASYSAGVALNAVGFGQPLSTTLLVLALGWAFILPLWRVLQTVGETRKPPGNQTL